MVCFPNAKINLGLQIIEKMANGYHALNSVMMPIGLCDALEIVKSDVLQFNASGFAIPGNEQDNLCIKAFEIIQADYKVSNVKIHLHKNIPMGAGLGGGSADAAFMLVLLNNFFQLNILNTKLQEYAAKLGSDCAFFIENKPQMATSRGEVLRPVMLSTTGYKLLLCFPELHINTAWAYSVIKPKVATIDLEQALQAPLTKWKDTVVNDFEAAVFTHHPILNDIKNSLYAMGASYAAMSGSGATMFGIFKDSETIDTTVLQSLCKSKWVDFLK